jgi:hypothetical protein
MMPDGPEFQEMLSAQPGSHSACPVGTWLVHAPCQQSASWQGLDNPWLPGACLLSQDSLGGNSRTLMIACISAADDSLDGEWHP